MENNRPKWNDEMLKELANTIGFKISEWCQGETDLKDCTDAAMKVLKHHSNDDGYEIAKQLERLGFQPNSELVEEMACVSYEKNSIIKEHIRNWVKDNSLTLKLPIGTKIKFNLPKQGISDCEITKHYSNTLQYGIWSESMNKDKKNYCVVIDAELIAIGEPLN